MTSRTHREFAIGFTCIGIMLLYKYRVSEIYYYFIYLIMMGLATKGALFPDVDHAWRNVKDKTVTNWLLNKAIHLTGGTHRSWQTHSIDICIISCIILYRTMKGLYGTGAMSDVNYQVGLIILVAYYTGWLSHLVSDMLTTAGIYIFLLKKMNIKLVPKKIGKLKFTTGDVWEKFVYQTTLKVNVVLTIITLIYPFIFDLKTTAWIMNILERW